jgi:hypothetical protein
MQHNELDRARIQIVEPVGKRGFFGEFRVELQDTDPTVKVPKFSL